MVVVVPRDDDEADADAFRTIRAQETWKKRTLVERNPAMIRVNILEESRISWSTTQSKERVDTLWIYKDK